MDILKSKVALITGGTSGMGAATVRRFHAEGALVVVTGSSAASIEAARKEMREVEVIARTPAIPRASKALVEHVREKYGRIDVLFVNAGMARVAPIGAFDEEFFDRIRSIHDSYGWRRQTAQVLSIRLNPATCLYIIGICVTFRKVLFRR